MVDIDSYAEPFAAMRKPLPLAVSYTFRIKGATAWQWRTVPAEAASKHFAISPDDLYDHCDLSLTRSYATGWTITHIPSGLKAAHAEFLPWAREWANRAETFADWSAPDIPDRHHAGEFTDLEHQVRDLERDFEDRYARLEELCDSPRRAERQWAYRKLRRLGAEYQPPNGTWVGELREAA